MHVHSQERGLKEVQIPPKYYKNMKKNRTSSKNFWQRPPPEPPELGNLQKVASDGVRFLKFYLILLGVVHLLRYAEQRLFRHPPCYKFRTKFFFALACYKILVISHITYFILIGYINYV